MLQRKRPVNLDLRTINFPPMAIASILHRISGIFLFLLLPVMIYFLSLLTTATGFVHLTNLTTCFIVKIVLWLFGASLIYHSLAGLRHLIMDFGYGETVVAGRRSALVVILLSLLCIIFLGIWIW